MATYIVSGAGNSAANGTYTDRNTPVNGKPSYTNGTFYLYYTSFEVPGPDFSTLYTWMIAKSVMDFVMDPGMDAAYHQSPFEQDVPSSDTWYCGMDAEFSGGIPPAPSIVAKTKFHIGGKVTIAVIDPPDFVVSESRFEEYNGEFREDGVWNGKPCYTNGNVWIYWAQIDWNNWQYDYYYRWSLHSIKRDFADTIQIDYFYGPFSNYIDGDIHPTGEDPSAQWNSGDQGVEQRGGVQVTVSIGDTHEGLEEVIVSVDESNYDETDVNGNYNIVDLNNGSYTVTPEKEGFVFIPESKSITLSNNDVHDADFIAEVPTIIKVNGTVYMDYNQTTTIGSNKTIALSVNGESKVTTKTNSLGKFYFDDQEVKHEDILTVFISGETEKGNLVIRYHQSSPPVDLILIKDMVRLNCSFFNSMSNEHLAIAAGLSDNDIKFSIVNDDVVFDNDVQVTVRQNRLYNPYGNITCNSIIVDGILQMDDKTLTLNGSGTPFVVNGEFDEGFSTVVYKGSSNVHVEGVKYYNLVLDKTNSTFSPNGDITITNNLTVENGTLLSLNETITFDNAVTPFSIKSGGSFVPGLSSVVYKSDATTEIPSIKYHNLLLQGNIQGDYIVSGAGHNAANGDYMNRGIDINGKPSYFNGTCYLYYAYSGMEEAHTWIISRYSYPSRMDFMSDSLYYAVPLNQNTPAESGVTWIEAFEDDHHDLSPAPSVVKTNDIIFTFQQGELDVYGDFIAGDD